MGFFSGKNHIEIKGNKPSKLLNFTNPKLIAIPLKHMDSEGFDIHVQVGDSVKIGTNVATGNERFKIPLFSSVSGKVTAIEKRDHVSLKKSNHIVIENDFNDEKELLFEPTENINSLSGEEIREFLKKESSLGLGSAGFAYAKYRNAKNIHTVLLNGMEQEPCLSTCEFSMKADPQLLLEGARLLMTSVEAGECIIAMEENKTELINILEKMLKDYPGISLKLMPDIYPSAWDKLLINRIFNKDYKRLPLEIGIICDGVSAAIELARCIKTGLPMYEKIITLTGLGFKVPKNVTVRQGTILADIVQKTGGYMEGAKRLLHGGYFTGSTVISQDLSVTFMSDGFVCLPDIIVEEQPCSRCGRCLDYCPMGLQPVQIVKAFKSKDKEAAGKLSPDKCIECGVCSYVCPSDRNVSDSVVKCKALLK